MKFKNLVRLRNYAEITFILSLMVAATTIPNYLKDAADVQNLNVLQVYFGNTEFLLAGAVVAVFATLYYKLSKAVEKREKKLSEFMKEDLSEEARIKRLSTAEKRFKIANEKKR